MLGSENIAVTPGQALTRNFLEIDSDSAELMKPKYVCEQYQSHTPVINYTECLGGNFPQHLQDSLRRKASLASLAL